jgi:hypothetical protein
MTAPSNVVEGKPTEPAKSAQPSNPSRENAALSLPSVFTYFSMISPFLVVLLFVFISIINSNLKGFIYLLGIFILFFIVLLFQNVLRQEDSDRNPYCQVFNFPMPIRSVPSFNSSIFLYTLVYLFLPMMMNDVMNLPLLILLLILYAVDTVIKTGNRCTSPIGIVLGSFVGLIWGLMWYFVIQNQVPELLYYDDLISNKIACSRPSQQQFKCSVYKNGELLKTL